MPSPIKVPQAGESVTEAEIANWKKKEGDYVERDEVLLELETDKASMEIRAEVAGVLSISAKAGAVVKVGQAIGSIDETKAKTTSAKVPESPAATPAPSGSSSPASYAKGHPSPAASGILADKGIKPETITGTGPDGRITKNDALGAQAAPVEKSNAPEVPGETPSKPLSPGVRSVRREKLTRLRRTIANRLVEAKQTMALLTTFNEVDLTAVMECRKKYKELFTKKNEIGLGFMSFFTKATAIALQEFPIINARMELETIAYHDYCDIGIAVSTPKGLVVPVLRHVENLSFAQIEKQISTLAKLGRDSKLSPEHLEGGTFTITNGGTFGSMMSTPIVNFPQSAILGMHNIVERPMAVGGQVLIRPMMYVALTYDHRIIDGSDSVRFLYRIKELLEDPNRMLLGV